MLDIGTFKAKDIMKAEVVCAAYDMTVAEVEQLFEDEDITGVPVVNSKGKVIGVVSETDVVAADTLRENEGPREDEEEKHFLPVEKTVEDIMTPWVVSVTEETPVAEIARKMLEEGVHRVLVMDSEGRLQGIVTSMDIVRLVAE